MDEAELMAMRRDWYSTKQILYQVILNLMYRETVFISYPKPVHRCIKANSMDILNMNFERYQFLDLPMNLYGSLAIYPRMPIFSFNRFEKRKQMDEFNLHYKEHMTEYDFLVDIDNGENIYHALETLIKVKEFFKDIPHYCLFSGKKGYHIRVDYKDFPDEFKQMGHEELADRFKKFGENFAIINGFEDYDYSIYDLRRIAKTPYSVVYPTFNVALPMSDEMIYDFNLDYFHLSNLINKKHLLTNRGVLKRPGDPEKFRQLINKYAGIK